MSFPEERLTFFTGIIGDYKGLQSLLSRLGRFSRLNSKLVKIWYQKSWHYSCCDNDNNNNNNNDHNNSHYNISDWMRIKLFDECLGSDGNMCHQRQYSLLMKIFQKVVLVLLYTKTCICKKPFSFTQCTTPFIHLQSYYLLMWKKYGPAWVWKSWKTR